MVLHASTAVLALLLAAGCGAGPATAAARSLTQMTTMVVPERMAPSAEAAGEQGRRCCGNGGGGGGGHLSFCPCLASSCGR